MPPFFRLILRKVSMQVNNWLILTFGCVLIMSFVLTEHHDEENSLMYPKKWPQPSYNFKLNPLSEKGFELGKKLFHDPKLSRDGTISCASCHSQYNAFTHVDHDVSHGIEDRKGTRNSPVLINLAWNKSFHWDGGVNNLEVQPLNPLQHAAEMDNTLDAVIEYLNNDEIYPSLFYAVFSDSIVTTKHLLKAMAQYTVSLVSANSKYDQYLKGEATFTAQEKAGLKLFNKHCHSCHTAPLFNSNQFANNGLAMSVEFKDVGRYKITELGEDSLQFRIPTLRNIAYSFPYMHDGRMRTLKEVLNHYAQGIDSKSPYLSEGLKKKLNLSEKDQKDIIAFLHTLTDREFLFNKRFSPTN